ncbi:MAG: hypothetical protein OER21_00500 [Gemmatimonadota bacterium]|nr:hypothetical protein [Gemmatimonadota bacterium]
MRRASFARVVFGTSLAAVLPVPALVAQQAAPACADDPLFATLDFWVGTWTVWSGPTQVGTNRITKILQGCAITEEWRSASGGEGRSLFYVPPGARHWQQVWVTGGALAPGGTKEKRQRTDSLPGGAIRFEGLIRHGEREWLDRTTLTPNADGTVRQVIEISVDGGATWRPTFDAVYRPVAAAPETPGGER